jgi:hypothetical protein
MSGRRNKRTRRGDVVTSWRDERKRGGDSGDEDDDDDDGDNNDYAAAAAAEGQRWRQRWRGVGQASGGRSDGNGHLTRRKWLFSGNGNNVGTIDRNFYIGNVLQKLHINRYKIIALQCSRLAAE